MADEEVMGATSPPPSDHKRKLEDLEPDAPEPPSTNGNSESDDAANGDASDDSDAKRPRLDDNSDGLVDKENGYEEKTDEPKEEVTDIAAVVSNNEPEHTEQQANETQESVDKEVPAADANQTEAALYPSGDNPQSENAEEASAEDDLQEPTETLKDPLSKDSQVGNDSSREEKPAEGELTSRKMEVPSNKVGVLIGKAGDTIRTLQNNSGARIQITRDADADPTAGTRPVELIGTLESIIKAEKLIKDVIAEADAGGSPSLVARGFSTVHSSGATEQIQIQVPNEKVGLIIGKGGETIKNLQTRSGARIQLIPQHLPEGDQSKERTVRVTGDKKQIEIAREMIKEAMNQPVRSSNSSGGYNQQQGFRPRGPAGPQWGPRGPHPSQPSGYDYQQRGTYSSQNPQYPTPAYGNYPPHQGPPRGNFGWEQRPPTNMQGAPQTGYDYWQGGAPNTQMSNAMHGHAPGPGMGPPPSQAGYYGQPQAPDYGQQPPYSQNAAPPQGYGHGYNEAKYENQGPTQHPYGGHASQPAAYPQGATHPGYGQQDQYGKPPSYNMPQQGPYAQPYGQPRPSQPGDVPYQGPVPSNQSYGPNAPAQQQQQPYPYASSGPMQQGYPPYGSAPANDGYNQAGAAPYPQQGAQPVAGYAQPGVQQATGYAQAGPAAAYGQYPAPQAGMTEQAAQNNAGYGYQGVADPNYAAAAAAAAYGGAPPAGQPAYSQPAPTQPGYDQSVQQAAGGYGNVPVAYGKSVSPQPGFPQQQQQQQYDASQQMYAGHR